MAILPRPPAEAAVDEQLVAALLADQHADLAGLPVRHVAGGWDNEMFRLGDGLAVRLPRREAAVRLLEHELRWLPGLADRLPLPVPAPLRAGRPGAGYPWPWAVVPWYDGAPAATHPPADPSAAAEALGRFVSALGRPAPPDAPVNPYRGVPLAARDQAFRARVETLVAAGTRIDRGAVLATWEEALAAPPWPGPPVWLHGDLHPGNLVVRAGRLAAVIDFGDLTAGDPATDLAAAWMLLAPPDRRRFRAAAGALGPVDDATWVRARGNALAHGVACLAGSADTPLVSAIGRRTVAAVLADPG